MLRAQSLPRALPVLSVALTLALAYPAQAGSLEVVPTRARGMGGALRGGAAGSAAMALNPSGISLVRTYVAEGAYHYLQQEGGHLAQVAITDSTSASNIGGGVQYTYATGSKVNGGDAKRHDFALALAFPFGEYVTIGATGHYIRSETGLGNTVTKRTGYNFDAGLSLRPSSKLSLGFVGYGLKNFHDPQVPQAWAGGVVLAPIAELIFAFDTVVDTRRHDPSLGKVWSFMGGAEYSYAARFGARLGGGRDGLVDRGYVTAGLSAMTESGALDAGARLDLGGTNPMYVGVALRLFVPSS